MNEILNEIDLAVESAQYVDGFENIYERKKHLSLEEMTSEYISKITKMSAFFTKAEAEIAGLLTNAENEKVKTLKDFGNYYGIAFQIVNDVADFIPSKKYQTVGKNENDTHNDLLLGKLTLPIIYGLHNGSKNEKNRLVYVLENKSATNEELLQISKDLVNNGGIEYSKKFARNYMNEAHRCLKIFPKNTRRYFSESLSIFRNNKYYKELDLLKLSY